MNTTEFISKSQEKHGTEKYDYTETVFRTLSEKVTIGCQKHGLFEQRADSHLNGHGCYECAREARRSDPSRLMPWDLYTAECEKHGDYEISEIRREQGYRCPKCMLERRRSHYEQYCCQIHGDYEADPRIQETMGCPKCRREARQNREPITDDLTRET